MSYEIFKFTKGDLSGACVLVGKGRHEGTLRHVSAQIVAEIVSAARSKAREGGHKVKRETLLLDPENSDGPEVLAYVAERFDQMFQAAHYERLMPARATLSRLEPQIEGEG